MPIILLLLVPVLEITGLIIAAIEIGFLHILLWTIVTGYWGKYLMSSAPREQAMNEYMKLGVGAEIGGQLITRYLAASLIMIPGLITDILGILLLIPFVQKGLVKGVIKAMPKGGIGASFTMHSMQGGPQQKPERKTFADDGVIDADYTVVNEDKET